MIKAAIDRILELDRPETYKHGDGRTFIRGDFKPLLDPDFPFLKVNTLSGFCDYLIEITELDPFNNKDVFIHVESHLEATAYLPVQGSFNQRHKVIRAVTPENIVDHQRRFFGSWHKPEPFIIALKSMFIDQDDRPWLIHVASSLRQEFSNSLTDNGIAQTINIKKGASLASTETMKSTVVLSPFRSFAEIEQVSSEFIFRLKEENGEILCGLFEADGGFWKIDAANTIKAFIQSRMEKAQKTIPIII